MKYLRGADVEEARAALMAELPGFEISSLRLGKQGWDNHTFVLNEAWIVRFPKDREFQARQERWVTRALADRSPIAIPRFELEGRAISFVGYRMLAGVQLSEVWPACNGVEQEAIIDRLVDFCAAMHRSLSVDEAKANGLGPEELNFEFARAWVKAGGEWSGHASRALARVDAEVPVSCVLHNDLHGENILIDPETHEVTAVIDFGDVACGDPCSDLNYLCEFDLHQAERIAHRYREAGGEIVDPQRIRDLYFLQTLDECLDPDIPDEERGRFREMIEEYVGLFLKAG